MFNPTNQASNAFRATFGDNLQSTSGLYASDRLYGQFSSGGNLHDTFKVDRYENIYNSHTTIDLGAGVKIPLDW